MVVKIPAGATNIEILQHSYSGRPEDDNYLGKQPWCMSASGANCWTSVVEVALSTQSIFKLHTIYPF